MVFLPGTGNRFFLSQPVMLLCSHYIFGDVSLLRVLVCELQLHTADML